MQLLLALSGGGFRATIFHLGVIRFFRDSGLLTKVAAVSSVSGGTIAAAHLVLNWRDYNGPLSAFQNQIAKIRAFTQFGLRNRLFRRDVLYTLRNSFCRNKYTITDRLRDYYENQLFSENDTLSSLQGAVDIYKAPTLYLMTTTLTRPTAICYFEPGRFVLRDAYGHQNVTLDAYPVAAAVAASSAFPLLFPPMRISAEDCQVYQLAFGLPPQYLTDGGVFENLGITVLRDHAALMFPAATVPASPGGDPYRIVVSNAGATLDWDLATRFAQKRFRSILRSVEIVQYWAEERLKDKAKTSREILINIADTVNPAHVPGYPSRECQQQGARFRTDFDSFSALEWQVLYDHGYSIAKQALQSLFAENPSLIPPAAPQVDRPYNPWQGIADTPGAERRINGTLVAARHRRWRPWVGLDKFSAFYMVLLLVFASAFYFGWPIVWQAFEEGAAFFSEMARKDMGRREIEFYEPQLAGSTATLQHSAITREARVAVENVSERLLSGLPRNWALLLIEQKNTFGQDCRTQARWLRFHSNAKARAGIAYLIDTAASPNEIGYREIRMPKKEPEGRLLEGSVEIERAKKSELLVFVLVVEARVPMDAREPFPGTDVNGYHFKLEVSR